MLGASIIFLLIGIMIPVRHGLGVLCLISMRKACGSVMWRLCIGRSPLWPLLDMETCMQRTQEKWFLTPSTCFLILDWQLIWSEIWLIWLSMGLAVQENMWVLLTGKICRSSWIHENPINFFFLVLSDLVQMTYKFENTIQSALLFFFLPFATKFAETINLFVWKFLNMENHQNNQLNDIA